LRLLIKRILPKFLIRAYRRLRYGRAFNPELEVEMNGIAPEEIASLVEENGGSLLHAEEQKYWVRKQES
jgi:hypothetical protein